MRDGEHKLALFADDVLIYLILIIFQAVSLLYVRLK